MRTLVISAGDRPHVTDNAHACWCRPEQCGDHWHHRDINLTWANQPYMSAYSEQRSR